MNMRKEASIEPDGWKVEEISLNSCPVAALTICGLRKHSESRVQTHSNVTNFKQIKILLPYPQDQIFAIILV
jgi:hypothetical protein